MDADKTNPAVWLSAAQGMARHGWSREEFAYDIAVKLASAYREGLHDAQYLKPAEEKAHLITVHQPDGQIVTVKNTEAKEE